MQFTQFLKKNYLAMLNLLARTISLLGIIVFQSHLRAINVLVFLSILDLLLLNNFLKNENQEFIF